jgi:putative hydrolase of the HAD superfamily
MIRSVLFDFGGTLDADGWHWLDRFYHIYSEIGLKDLPKDRIKDAFYAAERRLEEDPATRTCRFRDMVQRHVREQFRTLGINSMTLEATAVAAFADPAEQILKRNAGILATLKSAGFKLGLVSNNYGNMETLCREFGYNNSLSVVIDSAIVGLRKPELPIFKLALEKLGSPATQTAFVGDSLERDILPARQLGMKTFWLIRAEDQNRRSQPVEVDQILHSLKELPQALGIQLVPTRSHE